MKAKIFILAILQTAIAACTKQKPQENTGQEIAPIVIEEDDSSIEPVDVVEPTDVEQPKIETQRQITTAQSSSTTSSSATSTTYYYDDVEDDETEDYYDNLRKHSPTDNYLLGFDEDVDDIHDMEIYMEDY